MNYTYPHQFWSEKEHRLIYNEIGPSDTSVDRQMPDNEQTDAEVTKMDVPDTINTPSVNASASEAAQEESGKLQSESEGMQHQLQRAEAFDMQTFDVPMGATDSLASIDNQIEQDYDEMARIDSGSAPSGGLPADLDGIVDEYVPDPELQEPTAQSTDAEKQETDTPVERAEAEVDGPATLSRSPRLGRTQIDSKPAVGSMTNVDTPARSNEEATANVDTAAESLESSKTLQRWASNIEEFANNLEPPYSVTVSAEGDKIRLIVDPDDPRASEQVASLIRYAEERGMQPRQVGDNMVVVQPEWQHATKGYFGPDKGPDAVAADGEDAHEESNDAFANLSPEQRQEIEKAREQFDGAALAFFDEGIRVIPDKLDEVTSITQKLAENGLIDKVVSALQGVPNFAEELVQWSENPDAGLPESIHKPLEAAGIFKDLLTVVKSFTKEERDALKEYGERINEMGIDLTQVGPFTALIALLVALIKAWEKHFGKDNEANASEQSESGETSPEGDPESLAVQPEVDTENLATKPDKISEELGITPETSDEDAKDLLYADFDEKNSVINERLDVMNERLDENKTQLREVRSLQADQREGLVSIRDLQKQRTKLKSENPESDEEEIAQKKALKKIDEQIKTLKEQQQAREVVIDTTLDDIKESVTVLEEAALDNRVILARMTAVVDMIDDIEEGTRDKITLPESGARMVNDNPEADSEEAADEPEEAASESEPDEPKETLVSTEKPAVATAKVEAVPKELNRAQQTALDALKDQGVVLKKSPDGEHYINEDKPGKYLVQEDGNVFYTGNSSIPPQTFRDGRWRKNEKTLPEYKQAEGKEKALIAAKQLGLDPVPDKEDVYSRPGYSGEYKLYDDGTVDYVQDGKITSRYKNGNWRDGRFTRTERV